MSHLPYSLDLSNPTHLRATMARQSLTYGDLSTYWSPDTDSMVDPLDDQEIRSDLRVFMAKLWIAALDAERGGSCR